MRSFIVGLLMLVGVGSTVMAENVKFQFVVPNLEYTKFLDFEGESALRDGLTSRFLGIGDFDVRAGYMDTSIPGQKKPVLAISYDIRKLEKLGININYFWGESVKLSLCGGMSYNFNTRIFSGSGALVWEVINFNK